MFNEIEKIEIALRRAVMQITADMTGNPFWLTDSSYFLDSSKFNETMRAISKEYIANPRRSSFSISNEPTQNLTHQRGF